MFDGDLAHNFEIGHISYVALVSVSVHMCACRGGARMRSCVIELYQLSSKHL